jgi:hypothetical protein
MKKEKIIRLAELINQKKENDPFNEEEIELLAELIGKRTVVANVMMYIKDGKILWETRNKLNGIHSGLNFNGGTIKVVGEKYDWNNLNKGFCKGALFL